MPDTSLKVGDEIKLTKNGLNAMESEYPAIFLKENAEGTVGSVVNTDTTYGRIKVVFPIRIFSKTNENNPEGKFLFLLKDTNLDFHKMKRGLKIK